LITKTNIKKSLDNPPYYKVVRINNNNGARNFKSYFIKFAKRLGNIRIQNKKNDKILEIKANLKKIKLLKKKKKKIKSFLRYHETNLGGSIHSDGPQLSNPPKYLIMACENNSVKGGDTVVADTKKIYKYLSKKKPEYLNILKSKFFFERRGFKYSNKNVFNKSIFQISKKKYTFRYLRDYIEKGYEIKKTKIPFQYIKALNYLDKLLSSKKFIKRFKLNRGDLIIINNQVMAHGRTTFQLDIKNINPGRKLYRIWIN